MPEGHPDRAQTQAINLNRSLVQTDQGARTQRASRSSRGNTKVAWVRGSRGAGRPHALRQGVRPDFWGAARPPRGRGQGRGQDAAPREQDSVTGLASR